MRDKLLLFTFSVRSIKSPLQKQVLGVQQVVAAPPYRNRDALFLQPLSSLEEWLTPISPAAARKKVIMLVFTALAYGYVDYATALLRAPLLERYFDAPIRQGL